MTDNRGSLDNLSSRCVTRQLQTLCTEVLGLEVSRGTELGSVSPELSLSPTWRTWEEGSEVRSAMVGHKF